MTRVMVLSVLIPVYNELGNLAALRDRLLAALDNLGVPWEVVLADDGSSDGSPDLLDQIAMSDHRFKIVHLRRNFGQTAALMAALHHSKGDTIIMMDADLQNDPEDIAPLIQKLSEGYDVVSGWRKDRRDREFGRGLPSRVANKLISWLSGVPLHDFGCTLKAYRRWTIENVRLYGEMHRYIPIYATWEGAKVAEVVVKHQPRLHEVSKYGVSRVTRVLLDLIVIFFLGRAMDRPMQFFGRIGLYLLGSAILLGSIALWLRFVEGVSLILTPLPLLTVLLLLVSLLCLLFGVLAELQMRTYYESRRIPTYRIRNTVNVQD